MAHMIFQQESLFNAELDTDRMTDAELELELRYRIDIGESRSDRLRAIHDERARRKEAK